MINQFSDEIIMEQRMLLSEGEFKFWFLPDEGSIILGYIEVVNAINPLKINEKTYLIVVFSQRYGASICEYNQTLFEDSSDVFKILTAVKPTDISKFESTI